ncbi:DUF1542 domain-containing protein [Kineosporia sp. NBRC 101731]|uniref:DUF1542 domain-containing protein n=1 Tax=Kineosporia sp. NBRC 101731 TaxID=3032199 RepID=UPI0024A111D9|nr:DUF1542 domain-containing protein [Kineosporia sp. NBRC 101731]GLY28080.1 hypothetical protein Kisp02_14450 [Kineosporia sp. NBRC 101731]
MLMFIFTALLIAGAVGWFMNRPTPVPVQGRPVDPQNGYQPYQQPSQQPGQPGQPGRLPDYGTPSYGYIPTAGVDLSDARAEASHWVERLGGGITALEGTNDGTNVAARQSMAEATERHASARRQLAEAVSAKQIQLAGRTAIEGLHYLRSARTALGLDPGPAVPQESSVPAVEGTRRVTVNNEEYVASSGPGNATPYYYPGGQVQGRTVPAGWYSRPWWKTAMVAGAAGIGSMLVLDALFGGHGPGFGGLGGHEGFGDHGFGGGPGGPDGFGGFGEGFGDGFGF